MTGDRQFGRLDRFRVCAALLVICIHTSPLSSLNPDADFLLTRVFARLAVPIFLMATGCFVLPSVLFASPRNTRALWRFVKKNRPALRRGHAFIPAARSIRKALCSCKRWGLAARGVF